MKDVSDKAACKTEIDPDDAEDLTAPCCFSCGQKLPREPKDQDFCFLCKQDQLHGARHFTIQCIYGIRRAMRYGLDEEIEKEIHEALSELLYGVSYLEGPRMYEYYWSALLAVSRRQFKFALRVLMLLLGELEEIALVHSPERPYPLVIEEILAEGPMQGRLWPDDQWTSFLLNGQPLKSGDEIEFEEGNGWTPAQFQWTGRWKDNPELKLMDGTTKAIPEEVLFRWPAAPASAGEPGVEGPASNGH